MRMGHTLFSSFQIWQTGLWSRLFSSRIICKNIPRSSWCRSAMGHIRRCSCVLLRGIAFLAALSSTRDSGVRSSVAKVDEIERWHVPPIELTVCAGCAKCVQITSHLSIMAMTARLDRLLASTNVTTWGGSIAVHRGKLIKSTPSVHQGLPIERLLNISWTINEK
jgi:hypothetical protein